MVCEMGRAAGTGLAGVYEGDGAGYGWLLTLYLSDELQKVTEERGGGRGPGGGRSREGRTAGEGTRWMEEKRRDRRREEGKEEEERKDEWWEREGRMRGDEWSKGREAGGWEEGLSVRLFKQDIIWCCCSVLLYTCFFIVTLFCGLFIARGGGAEYYGLACC